MLRTPSDFERAYLAGADDRAQSGFNGSPERWRAAREGIVEAIDRDGTFLDVGCANGLLLESVVNWSPFAIDPYRIDFAPGLVHLARRRLPQWADRLWVADVFSWIAPQRFDFVHARWELGAVERCSDSAGERSSPRIGVFARRRLLARSQSPIDCANAA